jgi:hypothetical protein
MRQAAMTMVTNPRLVFAANDRAVVNALAKADLNEGQNEALGERLLHFDISKNASDWLRRMGGRDYTEGWVGTGTVPGRIAQHIWYLFLNRGSVQAGNRFLVHGNATGLFEKAMLDDGLMPYVAIALETSLSIFAKNGEMPDGWALQDGTVGVNGSTLAAKVDAENVSAGYNKTSPKKIAAVLQDSLGAQQAFVRKKRLWMMDPTRALTLLYLHDKNAAPFEEYLRDAGFPQVIDAAFKAST